MKKEIVTYRIGLNLFGEIILGSSLVFRQYIPDEILFLLKPRPVKVRVNEIEESLTYIYEDGKEIIADPKRYWEFYIKITDLWNCKYDENNS